MSGVALTGADVAAVADVVFVVVGLVEPQPASPRIAQPTAASPMNVFRRLSMKVLLAYPRIQ